VSERALRGIFTTTSNHCLALLALELEQLRETPAGADADFRDHLGKRVSTIVSDVHAISHELHSSKLELLGLVAAAKSLCCEFAKQKQVEIDFSHHGAPRFLPSVISICLFRVLQEALQNAFNHSKVRSFRVQLHAASGEVHLMVRDSGVGFEPRANAHVQGLGLISMQERVALVGGTISVSSKPHVRTIIKCSVPIASAPPAASVSSGPDKSRKHALPIAQ
jgi:signal transduction histidine kinase